MSKMKNLKISILRPAGNDTALVEGIIEKKDRKKINDAIMAKYPNVEQVGFYSYDLKNKLGILEMAGGEFCGNALRSLAYLLLKGKLGEINFQVSGTNQKLKAGVRKTGTSFAQMPIFKETSSVFKLADDVAQVDLEGIMHLIIPKPKIENPEDLKEIGRSILQERNLLYSTPASGVMFISQNGKNLKVDPVVWVRDIETLFYETACASGSTAIGLWEAVNSQDKTIISNIKQPSKKSLTVSIKKSENGFEDAIIYGPIEILTLAEMKI